jgi:outer membrane protein OmpA-like peptidoglycan-associated protein
MSSKPSQCWRAIAIGAAAWLALAALALFRGPDAPGSLAALNWQTESKAAQALKNAGLEWAHVRVGDGVLALSGAAPNAKAAGLAFATVRAATTAQYGFPGVYHTFTTAFATKTTGAPPTAVPPATPMVAAPSVTPESLTYGPLPDTPGHCEEEFRTAIADRQIQFPTGSAILPKSAGPLLAAITNVAQRCQAFKIVVGGHTDARGDPQFNQMLSEQRAASVLNYLVVHGVPRANISAVGYGASKLLSTERTLAAHRQNRRITFDVSSPP